VLVAVVDDEGVEDEEDVEDEGDVVDDVLEAPAAPVPLLPSPELFDFTLE